MQINWLNAQEEFESWYKGKDSFVFQFEDARQVMGAKQTRKVFTKGQPADYLITSKGVTFYAEVKSCSEPASFPFSNIQKSQWNCAIQVTAAGGQYYFYIRKEPERIWYMISAHLLIYFKNKDYKSIKWSELDVLECRR